MLQRIRALVVGINAYPGAPLDNAVNDAKAMKALLESKDVEVFDIYDCNITDLTAKTDEFVDALQEGDAAMVFFAGHGVEYNNTNRLVAITQSGVADLRNEALNALVLLNRLEP